MSSERKDEFLSWRGRLDSPEGILGQGLEHPEQTWERLMDRFRAQQARRLPVWSGRRRSIFYGIAAACLLLLMIPAWRLLRDRVSHPRPGTIRQVTLPVARADGERRDHAAAVPSAPMARLAEERAGRRGDGTTKRKGGVRPTTSVRTEMRTIAVTDDTIRTPVAPAVPLISQLPMARPVPKRNWKVVDLNDLHSGWQAPSGMASNRSVLPLRIGFGNADPPGGATGGPPSTGEPGIRIKLNTSN